MRYCLWDGTNLDELRDVFADTYAVEQMPNGNVKLSAAQNPSMYREFVVGTWIAGINNYLTSAQKSDTKQAVVAEDVEYLTQEST